MARTLLPLHLRVGRAKAKNISIVGGGRWARTIASVLCGLPGRADAVTMHSVSNGTALKQWALHPRFDGRLTVVDFWPAPGGGPERPDAIIVANRAKDHFVAAATALNDGIPVLVEKPVALSLTQIEELKRIARADTVILGASHVFLFARYVEAYAASAAKLGHPRSLRLIWTDGPSEIRRGETKSYDPAVTLFDDVLPHIAPMVAELQLRHLELLSLDIQFGGARLIVEAQANGRPVSLLIARNDEGRRRQIEVETDDGAATLDFTDEPGFIDVGGMRTNGDPQWDMALRPLGTMLSAFIAAVEGAPLDPRLSVDRAIESAALADAIRSRYVMHQVEWLARRLGEPLDPALRYALAEFDGNEAGSLSKAWPTIASRAELNLLLARSRLYSDAISVK